MTASACRLFLVLVFALGAAGATRAETRGELTALSAWVAKSQQKQRLDGKVARAFGLSPDGRQIEMTAVTTAFLDGSRIVYLGGGPGGEVLIFSQGKGHLGRYFLTNRGGALVRALDWVPTSANPRPLDAGVAEAQFPEIKAFWKNQLGRSVR